MMIVSTLRVATNMTAVAMRIPDDDDVLVGCDNGVSLHHLLLATAANGPMFAHLRVVYTISLVA